MGGLMTGKIIGIHCTTGSGLASVEVITEDHLTHTVPISSGFGLRQLFEAFDGEPMGKQIDFRLGQFGVMEGFTIPEEVTDED